MRIPDVSERKTHKFHNQYEIDARLTRNRKVADRNVSPGQGPLKMSDLFNK